MRQRRLPPDAKRLLEAQFQLERNNPYMSPRKMEELARQTGLSMKQIRVFFANSRARKLPPVTRIQHTAIDATSPNSNQRACTTYDILRSSGSDYTSKHPARLFSRHVGLGGIVGHAPGLANTTGTLSLLRSAPISPCRISNTSIDLLKIRGPRRGRKRLRATMEEMASSIVRKPSGPEKRYQCTWCTADFAQKYDWRRHEESIHFPQTEWVCLPNGITLRNSCAFCGEDKPDDAHFNTHNCSVCLDAPVSQRTFSRKDKLLQHIGQVHGCPTPKAIRDWYRPIQRVATLVCGICGLVLSSWSIRIE